MPNLLTPGAAGGLAMYAPICCGPACRAGKPATAALLEGIQCWPAGGGIRRALQHKHDQIAVNNMKKC